jgi:hypothetical protein
MRNQTTIENWIVCEARDRDRRRIESFIYPYNLGFKENVRQVFNWSDYLNLIGDGLTWPVCSGCDQYTLTREQLEQIFDKYQRVVRYKIVKSYNGSFFPLKYGLYTCLCIPCLNQSRIPIKEGDYVSVTRWKNYWLYGDHKYLCGWFPRCCVNERFEMEDLWFNK